ncbi:MAG TPA: zf-HC2 domain-containing protein [Blastocatellia bacterium]|nr:zf-HC2 domain-containing protein [Blastocatellia bacterium]
MPKFMNTHDRTECRAVDDLLVALAAGELEPELTSQLRAHLDECASCSLAFTGINRAQQLAVELKLASPELDRYPEFLRRLAAYEAQVVRDAELIAEPVESNPQIVALAPIRSERELAENAVPQAGAAAVIPLFGNRLIFRSGFGRGFDLQVTSGQNKELFHLSANSLAKAAAVVAGFGVFAAASLFTLGLMVVTIVQQWQKPQAQIAEQPRPEALPQEHRPQPADGLPQNSPWLQTVVGENSTLALWRAGGQIQASFMNRDGSWLSNPFRLIPALSPSEKSFSEPRATDCAAATDRHGFVVVREQSNSILAWHLTPSAGKPQADGEQPVVLSNRGFQPAIAWAGDRYLVVWIEPDPNLPKIKMIELGSDGRPLQPEERTVAESESRNGKLGTPSVVAQDGRAMIVYSKQGGGIIARIWNQADGLSGSAFELLQQKGFLVNRVLLAVDGGGLTVCLDETRPEGSELRFARVSFAGEVQTKQTLVTSRMPILSFDVRVNEEGIALIWSEAALGGAQILARRFSPEGIASTRVVNVTPTEIAPLAFAFADTEGKAMIWHEAQPAQGKFPVATRQIDWNR